MQKTVFIVSRFVFTGTLLSLMLALFMGITLSINRTSQHKKIATKKQVAAKVVLAMQNQTAQGGGMVAEKVVTADARPLLIKAYLKKYKSPLLPYADLIFELSQTYGFEYYWIPAIAQQESNLCKVIPENSHNCWGYGINSAGTLRFDSYELALKSYAEYLKREYFDKGRTTTESIMKKYCPSSNGSWAFGVNKFISDIESGKL